MCWWKVECGGRQCVGGRWNVVVVRGDSVGYMWALFWTTGLLARVVLVAFCEHMKQPVGMVLICKECGVLVITNWGCISWWLWRVVQWRVLTEVLLGSSGRSLR